ncbi:sulfurtransferase [Actinorhabdospora filicis]|uniref:Sulfurtransferase n=1 Tax=Actinorhabdospora filicis TaxID=1785913 RepID=A0A9W6SHT8_9ACTN|nr:rhodanese-like domain-containing protein [Actinorhabdospora filicis]GLZ76212.1 sulfurtransferase [Actinorhabdospora filicis]
MTGFESSGANTAANAAAIAHFSRRLQFETDVSDVHSAIEGGHRVTVVDTRGPSSWEAGRLPGAVHLPTGKIRHRALGVIPTDRPVIVYCWGPACNGATKAALAFAELGYEVKEMIGGFEYWVREGFAYYDEEGRRQEGFDRLVAPAGMAACTC